MDRLKSHVVINGRGGERVGGEGGLEGAGHNAAKIDDDDDCSYIALLSDLEQTNCGGDHEDNDHDPNRHHRCFLHPGCSLRKVQQGLSTVSPLFNCLTVVVT